MNPDPLGQRSLRAARRTGLTVLLGLASLPSAAPAEPGERRCYAGSDALRAGRPDEAVQALEQALQRPECHAETEGLLLTLATAHARVAEDTGRAQHYCRASEALDRLLAEGRDPEFIAAARRHKADADPRCVEALRTVDPAPAPRPVEAAAAPPAALGPGPTWLLIGAGGAALGGAVLGGLAWSTVDGASSAPRHADWTTEVESGRQLALAANVAWSTAAIAGVAGVVWWLLDEPEVDAAGVAVRF